MANSSNNSLRSRIDRLYTGRSKAARRFRYGLLAFDLAAITYFVVSSLWPASPWIYPVDLALAVLIGIDFLARFWISSSKTRYFSQLTTWADIIVIISLVAPAFFANLVFLRGPARIAAAALLPCPYGICAPRSRSSGEMRRSFRA